MNIKKLYHEKKHHYFCWYYLFSATVLFSSFISSDNIVNGTNINPPDEFEILLNYLETNNAFVNGESLPIIMADEVKKNIKKPEISCDRYQK